ncbi:unnamed protein product [Cylindrotheca closterium]|uniref:Uncharacterized protein n=1 Tax=Cylindrotheca closterium TaxID=2856 RepID=A0AAD2PVQ8_9STRA|nr:unnamed protein product [Cylindrotheca closterium]
MRTVLLLSLVILLLAATVMKIGIQLIAVAGLLTPFTITTTATEPTYFALDSETSTKIQSQIHHHQSQKCDRILLYATDYLNPVGIVAQLNTFLRAVLIAIVEDRRLVFLHSNDESMFGCPGNGNYNSSSLLEQQTYYSYPGGLSHVLDVSLLSRQCPPPPCQRIQKWHRLAYRVIQKKNMDAHIPCRDRASETKNSSVSVLLLGGYALRQYFRDEIQPQLDGAENLEEWGKRLGLENMEEIQLLHKDAKNNATHGSYRDRVMRLIKPLVRFQPWIINDVKRLITNYSDNNNTGAVRFQEMIGIHIRRGDKLKVESRYWVEEYWRKQGYLLKDEDDMPVNYVPLTAYLQKIPSPFFESSIRHVYIATDDPTTVRNEIQTLPDRDQWRFHFNPVATSSGHLNTLENCHDKYEHTIAAIFDLMVLESCSLFVGEYNSNWGRWIRFRREGEVRVVFGPTDVSWPR